MAAVTVGSDTTGISHLQGMCPQVHTPGSWACRGTSRRGGTSLAGHLSTPSGFPPPPQLTPNQGMPPVWQVYGAPVWRANEDYTPTPTTQRPQYPHSKQHPYHSPAVSLQHECTQLLKASRRAPQGDGDADRDSRCEGLDWYSQGANRSLRPELEGEDLRSPSQLQGFMICSA